MLDAKTKKILIVDDDPFILEMYMMKFKEEGFGVETVTDGKNGLKKCKEYDPDLVLLDIVMPGLDGFEVLKEIKKENQHRPQVVLLTNLGQKEDIDKGMGLGANDYIIKAHFTPSEVVAKVRGILEKI